MLRSWGYNDAYNMNNDVSLSILLAAMTLSDVNKLNMMLVSTISFLGHECGPG